MLWEESEEVRKCLEYKQPSKVVTLQSDIKLSIIIIVIFLIGFGPVIILQH